MPKFRLLWIPIFLALSFPICCKESENRETDMNDQQSMEKVYTERRERMVQQQIEARKVKDELVLDAMRKVPRHLFVPENLKDQAYTDGPLPIGEGQTISQPYIVALMTELLDLKGGEKVLEIGTGSGYQSAVLAEIAGEVYSIEIICSLAETANKRL